jgi:hypothetical protein
MQRTARLLAVMACTGVALAVGAAAAGEVKVVRAGSALNDMKVMRDKETGQLRAATSEEIAAMSQVPSRYAPNVLVLSRPATTTVNHPDGSATVRRSLDDLDSVVATRSADGKLVLRHGKQAAAASTQPLAKE